MTDLFLNVLNTSYSAIWVVLAVVLARLLLRKAPRGLVCALWALVAMRLLFGGIEAPFSLIPSAEVIPPESLFDQAPAIHTGVSSLDNAVNPIYSEALRPTPGASVNPLQVWLAVFANFWVLGMAAMALWAWISCRRVRKQIAESVADNGIFLCDRISSPFIFGLFRPKIYLPSDLPESARVHVIAHEKAHLSRRDHWWKPLGFLLLTVNWFNPALWLAYILLCRDIEMACDERVVRNFGPEKKKAYSTALLRCSVNPRRITACPLAFGEVGVMQRIKSVLHYKKPAFWIILAAVVLTTLLAAGLLTNPAETPETPQEFLSRELEKDLDYLVCVEADQKFGWETLQGSEKAALREILEALTTANFTPITEGQAPKYHFSIDFMEPDGLGCSFNLLLTGDDLWTLHFWDTDLGDNYWQLRDEALTAWAQPYLLRAKQDADLPAGQSILYRSVEYENCTMTLGVPDGWIIQELPETVFGGRFGLRCRPDGKYDWMDITFYDTEDTLYYAPLLDASISLRSGATGSLYHSGDPTRWNLVILDTTRAQLHITAPDIVYRTTDWTAEDYQTALEILGTLTLTENGSSLLEYPPSTVENLGITLSVKNATPKGLTMVCTQSGGRWDQITTGAPWTLEQWTDGAWVMVTPEETVWTAIAYSVNLGGTTEWNLNWSQLVGEIGPGRYRVGKSFRGDPQFSVPDEFYHETCYAEFIIE